MVNEFLLLFENLKYLCARKFAQIKKVATKASLLEKNKLFLVWSQLSE
jgi:hypothetical protein